ncbi:MAG: alpha-galactosidase [Catenulispora sp.]|nr:alpha-galactosidase [Catenulispora sp.]
MWRGAVAATVSVAAVPLIAFTVSAPQAQALGNNLALTPQMGFNDWNAYGCNVSESLIKSTALAMHNNGMQAAGYQYVNIDDCWLTHNRDGSGRLVPDPAKFPDGISGTATYVHSLGLKLGIYEDAGTLTCAGYPGSLGHEQTDADTFASWGVDYLKYDNCYSDGVHQTSTGGPSAQSRYTTMRDALARTGRPILFSLCNWGFENVWTWGAGVGNSWRTTGDINASYGSMLSIFHSNVSKASYAGPGAWNDPDMLEIGNGMSATEDRSEFSLWAEMAAPLISGTNIANASSQTLSILTNSRVIAVDQDPLGKQGTMVSSSGGLDVLAKPLANGDVSVALFNENSGTATISTTVGAIGKSGASSYTLTDLWSGATSTTTNSISASVPGHGTVMFRVAGGGTPPPPTGGPIHAVGAGKCLDVPNSSTTGGTQLDINTCSGAANQTFTHTSSNELSVYSGGSQMCLDANNKGTTNGTKVIIWTCNGQTNQQWNVNSDGSITGVQSGLCLDVTGAATANGTLVELWACNGQSNQKWTLG